MHHTRKTHFFLLCLPKYFSVRTVFSIIKNGCQNDCLSFPIKTRTNCPLWARRPPGWWRLRAELLGESRFDSLRVFFCSAQTSFGGPPHLLSNEYCGSSPSDEAEYSPSSAETKIAWNYTSTNTYVFIQLWLSTSTGTNLPLPDLLWSYNHFHEE